MQNLVYTSVPTRSGVVGYSVVDCSVVNCSIVEGSVAIKCSGIDGSVIDCSANNTPSSIRERPAIILLVGYTGTLFHWNSDFVIQLAEYFTVYLVDNRMIGLSTSSNIATTYGLALDVRDFIEAMQLKKPYVLGWSMGGTIVQELASFYQHNLSGIVLMSTLPDSKYTNPDFISLLHHVTKLKSAEFKERLYYFFFSESSSFQSKDYITKHALNFSNYNYRFSPLAKELQDSVISSWVGMNQNRLSALTKLPVLVLWAENNLVVPRIAQEIFTQYIPYVQLNAYINGGHFLIHSRPQQVATDIIDYFCHSPEQNEVH